MNKKYLFLIVPVLAGVLLFGRTAYTPAEAYGDYHFPTHTPTPTRTPTPTPYHHACNADHVCTTVAGWGKNSCWENDDCKVKPTLTPTPTIDPCHVSDVLTNDWEEQNPCPTPTATVSATPMPQPNPGGPGDGQSDGKSDGHNGPPGSPSCTIPFDAPVINGVKVNADGSITWSWMESESVDKFSMSYGKDPNNLIYGVDNLHLSKDPTTQEYSFTVNGLDLSTTSWAQVWAWKGGCAEKSNVFDP